MRAMTAATAVASLLVVTSAAQWLAASAMGQTQTASDCVTIGKPAPQVDYTYEHIESSGNKSRYSNRWEAVTDTGSRVRITQAGGTMIQVNEHHIADDVTVLDRSTKQNGNGGVIDSTVFRPGIVGDPAFRACAGKSWRIPPVTASYQSAKAKAAAATPAGTLRIVAIHEAITVPAGKFDTVHYIRTSQSSDEYWKSIEHGVVVKHIATVRGAVVTEVLLSVK